MKTSIHPKFNVQTKIVCACGNTFTTGSTQDEIQVEICSKCHPFYTGKLRIVDTASLVKKFEERKKGAKTEVVSRREKRASKRSQRRATSAEKGQKEVTLKDMLAQMS